MVIPYNSPSQLSNPAKTAGIEQRPAGRGGQVHFAAQIPSGEIGILPWGNHAYSQELGEIA